MFDINLPVKLYAFSTLFSFLIFYVKKWYLEYAQLSISETAHDLSEMDIKYKSAEYNLLGFAGFGFSIFGWCFLAYVAYAFSILNAVSLFAITELASLILVKLEADLSIKIGNANSIKLFGRAGMYLIPVLIVLMILSVSN